MALDTLDTWAAPFDNAECSLVTPVPYGDLHSVSPYVATPQVRLSHSRLSHFVTLLSRVPDRCRSHTDGAAVD